MKMIEVKITDSDCGTIVDYIGYVRILPAKKCSSCTCDDVKFDTYYWVKNVDGLRMVGDFKMQLSRGASKSDIIKTALRKLCDA